MNPIIGAISRVRPNMLGHNACKPIGPAQPDPVRFEQDQGRFDRFTGKEVLMKKKPAKKKKK
jgi:hypothetical protein